MEQAGSPEMPLRTRADYQAATEQCLAEMRRLQELIARDQVEIDRLKRETRALLAQLKAG